MPSPVPQRNSPPKAAGEGGPSRWAGHSENKVHTSSGGKRRERNRFSYRKAPLLELLWLCPGSSPSANCWPVSPHPCRSPALIGCFIVDRQYFQEIGLLDEGMEVYGGENVELGIRVSKSSRPEDLAQLSGEMNESRGWRNGGKDEGDRCILNV